MFWFLIGVLTLRRQVWHGLCRLPAVAALLRRLPDRRADLYACRVSHAVNERSHAPHVHAHSYPLKRRSRRSKPCSPTRSATRFMPPTMPSGKPTASSSAAEPFCSAVRCGSIFSLAHRPIANRYIRIDEMGRAQAIQYSDLNYSPREGEVRTYLTDWANYRYTINRDTIAKKYPLNYYFLSQTLASQLMAEDNQNHLVSQVVGGQIEQSDVEVQERHHYVHVRGDRSGRDDRAWNGARQPSTSSTRRRTRGSHGPSIGC